MYRIPLSTKFAVITYRMRGRGGGCIPSILEPLGFQVLKVFNFTFCLRNTGLSRKLNLAIRSHD